MRYRKTGIVAFFLAVFIAGSSMAHAGTTMAFRQGVAVWVNANGCAWKRCGYIPITVAEPGYVVVNASGMASFDSNAVLALTLSKKAAAIGDWQFWVTAAPPMPSFQSFNLRMVFKVDAPGTFNYFLNARGCNNPAGNIHVEVGSITAEFYPAAEVQPFPTTAVQQPPAMGARPVE